MDTLRDRAAAELRTAMRERDRTATSALRTLLAALDNAEAVPAATTAGAIEQSPVGVGATEATRRTLSAARMRTIAEGEIHEHREAAETARRHGRMDAASRLDRQAAVIRQLVDDLGTHA